MEQKFLNKDGKSILLAMVHGIQENKQYLGDIDGLIGDGDHGMNMNKGFSTFEKRFADKEFGFSEGLSELAGILMSEIGGSMGPIYGTIFYGMADASEDKDEIDAAVFNDMMHQGLADLCEIIDAKVGDKTIVDTLSPAVDAFAAAQESGSEFCKALEQMKAAAEAGKESTKDLVAKFGRSSRLGERSRGVLDAGATSCNIILQAMADKMLNLMSAE